MQLGKREKGQNGETNSIKELYVLLKFNKKSSLRELMILKEPIGVMIVDDEILAIEDLQQLISWEEYGFKIIAIATNGHKALELYEKHLPQIILADIRMPVMDGLEFSRRVLEYQNPVRIILLTAYKEFEYAKQAVAIGVSNYLLKHDINEENLVKELFKARADLEQEFHKNYILRHQLVRKLFNGENINDLSNFTGIALVRQNTDRLGLLLIQPDRPYLEEFRGPCHPLWELKLNLKTVERPEGVQWVEGYDCDGIMVIFVGLRKTNSRREERERLYHLSLNIGKELDGGEAESFSIIIARGCAVIEDISQYLQRAIRSLDYLVFFGRKTILHYEDLPAQPGLGLPATHAIFQNLANDIHDSDFEVGEMIDKVFQPILATRNPEEFKIASRQLFDSLERYRREHGLESLQQLYQEGKLPTKFLYYASEILSWLKEFFYDSFHQIKAGNLKCSRKVQQAMEYIHQHYAKDLTVENIAAALGISGVYLSQLFKKETNRTVLEYLTEYRIKIAKTLLEKGDYKIYEVAEMVGYKTSQYFSRVFQKVTGTYPLGYKEGEGRREARN